MAATEVKKKKRLQEIHEVAARHAVLTSADRLRDWRVASTLCAPELYALFLHRASGTLSFILDLIIYNPPFSERLRRDREETGRTGEFMERNFDEQITCVRTFGRS